MIRIYRSRGGGDLEGGGGRKGQLVRLLSVLPWPWSLLRGSLEISNEEWMIMTAHRRGRGTPSTHGRQRCMYVVRLNRPGITELAVDFFRSQEEDKIPLPNSHVSRQRRQRHSGKRDIWGQGSRDPEV